LTSAIATVVAAVVVLGFAGAYLLAAHELRHGLDQSLVRAATGVRLDVERDGWATPVTECRYLASPPCAQVVTASSDGGGVLPVSAGVRALTHGGASRFGTATLAGFPIRTYATPIGSGRVAMVGVRADGVDHSLARLRLVLSCLAAVGVLVGVLVGFAIATGLARPVRRLSALAEEVTADGDVSRRLRVAGGPTEVARLGASFDTMLAALEVSEAARRRLVSDASHELRTPLTSIRANAQLLASGRLDPDRQRRASADLVAGVDEMTALVGDVVDVARGEEHPHELETLGLSALVAAQVAAASRHWPGVDVALAATSGPDLVDGVRPRLARLVSNLLDNAAKFSPPGGPVEVTVEATADEIVLRVRDHGPGVAEEDLPHVFDRFYRAADARGLPGSGLGLAMVRQIAEAHHAEVNVARAPDGGTVVTVVFPAAGHTE